MKKIIIPMIVLILCFAIVPSAMAANPHVVDDAGLLTSAEESALSDKIDDIVDEYGFDVVIVTTYSCGNQNIMDYADDFYDYNEYGIGENNDGVLLLISMEERDWWISTTGYGITAFTDWGIEYVGEQIKGDLSDGDYYSAFDNFLNLTDDFLKQAKSGRPYDTNNKIMGMKDYAVRVGGAALIGLIVALIATGIMKSKLKSKRPNQFAHEYIRQGSFKITNSKDIYLYRTVNKTPRAESNNSGGGSSTHMGSSGTMHGGGGGKF